MLCIKFICFHPKPKAVANLSIFSQFQSPKSYSIPRSFQPDVLFSATAFIIP